MEDTDLSMRAWENGWRCYYEHEAICRHPASTTINKFHKKRNVWITTQRNKLILHELHLTKISKLIWNSRQAITLFVQAMVFRWKYHKAFLEYIKKGAEIESSKKRQMAICKDRPTPIETIMNTLCREINQQKIIRL